MDIYKILAIIALILLTLLIIVLSSRSRIFNTYQKYMKVANKANLTGKDLAIISKDKLNLDNLRFAVLDGKLCDAYSHKHKVLILSQEVCDTASLSALTIVAHELGHAMQDKEHTPLFTIAKVLNALTKFTNKFISTLLVVGLFLFVIKYPNEYLGLNLIMSSAILFGIHVLYQIINIPLEYNASKRALKYLKENNFVTNSELKKAKKLLKIAAQTYIANLFDGIFILNNKKRRGK